MARTLGVGGSRPAEQLADLICVYGEFGVRLEDHFYMTADGPRWFTEPSHSIDDPLAYS